MAMGPVHAVLANSDLLSMVFPATAGPYYDRAELFRLALVCRKFCAVALEILWKEIHGISQIYCLFPKDIVYTDSENTMSFSRPPVTRDQWARFDTYAWRVDKIFVVLPEPDLCMVLRSHPTRRHTFAHLTRLQWYGDVLSVSHAALVICSTLTDILFHLNGDGPDGAMADIIQAIRETCKHLQKFEYSHDGEFIPTSAALENSFVSLIRSSTYLRKVSVPTNYRIMDALALLPSLTQLSLSDPTENNETAWNLPYSAGAQSPDRETFVALERLDIWSNSTSVFLDFQKIASNPRVNLVFRINSEDPRSAAELPRHLHDVLHPNLKIGLEVFRTYRSQGRDFISQVHSWQSFSWLLASPHLQSLRLGGCFLEIDDTALAQMAQKWPELQVLDLFSRFSSTNPHDTFRGLSHLSLLPKLQALSLTIGPNCTILPSLLYSEKGSTSPLRDLKLRGIFPNADPLDVALFLGRHFPNLKNFWARNGLQWLEVNVRVKFLCQVLPEIPNGRSRLTSV